MKGSGVEGGEKRNQNNESEEGRGKVEETEDNKV